MVSASGGAPARADINFPLGRDEEIHDGEDLLLLIVEGDEIAELAVVSVVLDAEIVIFRGLVSERGGRAEREAARRDVAVISLLLDGREIGGRGNNVNVIDQGGVHGPIPTADGLVDDRHDLPGPGGIGVCRASVAEFR